MVQEVSPTARSAARALSAQVSTRTQVVHALRCDSSSASVLARRAAITCGVFVRTRIPSRTGVLQAAQSPPSPSTCTRQTRQEPMMLRFLSAQRVGILIPNASAASRMVASCSTSTCSPSMLSLTIAQAPFRSASLRRNGRSAGSGRIPDWPPRRSWAVRRIRSRACAPWRGARQY